MPALTRALKLQKKAATVGFDWDTAPPIVDKIREETSELAEAVTEGKPDHIEEEFGDLLFAMVNLGRHLTIDPEAALGAASAKFSRRFRFIEARLASWPIPAPMSARSRRAFVRRCRTIAARRRPRSSSAARSGPSTPSPARWRRWTRSGSLPRQMSMAAIEQDPRAGYMAPDCSLRR
jgi:phosphoribosyl-ATP pyrophosphohydrolase